MYSKGKSMFDQLKDRIGYRLINKENHKAQLQLCPHKDFLDLAKVYVLKLTEEPARHHLSKVSGKIVFGPEFEANEMDIDNSMLKTWHIALEELDKIAEKNISRLAPSFLCKNVDLLSAMGLDVNGSPFTEYVLTNIDAWDGAATMLYTDDIAKLAEKKASDVYILPSSIHELLLMPYENVDADQLCQMVCEINHSQVADNEILSDNIYQYSRKDKKIHLIKTPYVFNKINGAVERR